MNYRRTCRRRNKRGRLEANAREAVRFEQSVARSGTGRNPSFQKPHLSFSMIGSAWLQRAAWADVQRGPPSAASRLSWNAVRGP